jgi:hypothetical protein
MTYPIDNEARDDKGRWTDEPPPTLEANIARGRAAVAHVLATHEDAHRAMHRADLGWIDFVWGSEGEPPKGAKGKRKGAKGVTHIVEARTRKDGLDTHQVKQLLHRAINIMADDKAIPVLESFEDLKSSTKGTNAIFMAGGLRLIMSKQEGQNAWLMSVYELHRVSDASANGAGNNTATSTDPDPTRVSEVADMNTIQKARNTNNGGLPNTPKLLLDLTHVGCACTNQTLERLQKSMADPPDAKIWRPHENFLITASIEASSKRGESYLLQVQNTLLGLLGVAFSGQTMAKAAWPFNEGELIQAANTLKLKDPKTYTLEDWLVMVDLILATTLPPETIKDEAEYLAVRGAMAAELQAGMDNGVDVTQPSKHSARHSHALPDNIQQWERQNPQISPRDKAAVEFAVARAADNISLLSEQARHKMKHHVIEHLKNRAVADPSASYGKLEQTLREEFGALNRDWRRIAITEAGDAQTQGLILRLPVGSKVKRIEAYEGACGFCHGLHGQVFEVTTADNPNKDGKTQVWPGKSNVNRSASPKKRVGNSLVEREEHELWWAAAGLQHPNCRGTWQILSRGS